MACDLTTGRAKACFDTIAGIKKVYFSTEDLGAITYDVTDTDVITTFAGAPEFFEYDLKGNNNSYTETITKDVSNGTSFFAQSLAITLPKLTKEMNKELKLLVYASPTVIVQDFNDNYFTAGLVGGMDVTGGTIVSGAARGDLSGYTLTMTSEQAVPANFLFDADPPVSGIIEDTTATVSAVQSTP